MYRVPVCKPGRGRLRPKESAQNYAGLAEEARFLGVELLELLDDLRRAGVPVNGTDPDWRLDREIYRLDFTARPWIDLTNPDTIIAIKASGIAAAGRMMVADLTETTGRS